MTDLDFSELIERLEDAQEAGRGVRLSAEEVDEILWQLREDGIAATMQAHMITMLESEVRRLKNELN